MFNNVQKIVVIILSVLSIEISAQNVEFTEHIVAENYLSSWSVFAIDMDNDDDVDILSSARLGHKVTWWKNNGNQDFEEHPISNNASGAMGIHAGDIDNDNDIDVVCACDFGNKISWWENNDNQTFTEHIIANWQGPSFTYMDDVNDDSYLDILVAACESNSNKVAWFENDENQNFTEHILKDNWDHANSIYSKDIDGDNDIDIFATASWAGEIFWFENDGNENFMEHPIYSTSGRPSCVISEDLDQDGFNDIIATICQDNQIIWFQNDGNQNLTQNIITSNVNAPHSVMADDIDNDGYIDLICAAILGNEISWFENDGNENFTKHTVSNTAIGATDVFSIDIDDDGDKDIVGSARDGNQILWYENSYYSIEFIGDPFSGHAPLGVGFTDLSNFIEPVISWSWDFDNDGIVDSNIEDPVWIYEEPGTYSVSLEVSTGTFTRTLVKEDYITVFAGESGLFFDGAESYVLCPSTPSLNLTEAFTIEAWINPTGWGENTAFGFGRIIDKQRFLFLLTDSNPVLNDHSICLWLFHEDGSNSRSVAPDNSITLNSWQHVAATYDGISEVNIYVYGLEQSLTQTALPTGNILDNSDNDFVIGNSIGQNYTFEGTIDELRIWNVVRDEQQINDYMFQYLSGTEPGLVGYWRMNEGNGEAIFDFTSNANDGTLYDTSWITGAPMIMTSSDDILSNDLSSGQILYPNYPNPFNPETTISFNISHQGSKDAKLMIFNLKGQQVRQYSDLENQTSVIWDGKDETGKPVSSGLYFYKLRTETKQIVKKMILMK